MTRAQSAVAYGWAICTVPGIYVEAEHHGVWKRRAGDLVDVTPQPNPPKRISFLPADAAVHDPARFRSNVLKADGDDPLALEFVSLGNRRNAILDAYRKDGASLVSVSRDDQRETDRIGRRISELAPMLASTRTASVARHRSDPRR